MLSKLVAVAQESQYDYVGAWYIYNGFFKFSNKFEVFLEAQSRNYEVFSNTESIFIKPYYNYNLNENVQFGVSTEFHRHIAFATDPELKTSEKEFRTALQAIVAQPLKNVSLQHRYRYEFRNFSSVWSQRIRYRIQVTVPLNYKITPEKGSFFFNTSNELMVNANPKWEFDQNRLFMALGFYFNPSLNFQLGYMFISREDGTDQRLQVFLTQKLDFRKSKK
jgi:hypothetical protein